MQTAFDGGTFTIHLSGELDAGDVERVEDALREAEKTEGVSAIVLDLTRLDFIDSSGIATLGVAAKRDDEGVLRVTASTPQVERVLTLTGMADVLPRAS